MVLERIQAVKKQPFICGQQFTLNALLTLDGISVATVIEGPMTKALFLEWLEYTIVRISSSSMTKLFTFF